jgi:transcriptional regulator with XRE-family HTH domain
MVTQIRKHAKGHLYIEEHMEAKGLSFEVIGGRLNVSRTTVWRWAKEQWRLDPGKMAALAEAMELNDVADLFRMPSRPSIDAILKDAPQGIYDAVVEHAKALRKAS